MTAAALSSRPMSCSADAFYVFQHPELWYIIMLRIGFILYKAFTDVLNPDPEILLDPLVDLVPGKKREFHALKSSLEARRLLLGLGLGSILFFQHPDLRYIIMLPIGFYFISSFTEYIEIFVEKNNLLNLDSLNSDREILLNPDCTGTGTKTCPRQKNGEFHFLNSSLAGGFFWSLDVLFLEEI